VGRGCDLTAIPVSDGPGGSWIGAVDDRDRREMRACGNEFVAPIEGADAGSTRMEPGAAVSSVTLRPAANDDRRSGPQPTDRTRRRTCAVYTTDNELGRARSEQIYRPAIMMARRTLMTVDGDFAILDLGANGEPSLDQLRALSAGLAGLVIVYETPAPSRIIQAFGDAEKVDFDTRDPQWRQKLARRVAQALKDLVARQARREQVRPPRWKLKRPTGTWLNGILLGNAPVAAFAGAFLGCLTTLDFTALGIVPGIASAVASALLCGHFSVARRNSLFADAFFPALYGGTFAGMTPVLWLGGSAAGHSAVLANALIFSLSMVCGLAFFIMALLDTRSATPIGSGFGGRSGAIATVASFLFVQAAGQFGADASRFHGIAAGAFASNPWVVMLGFAACLMGIVGTSFALRQPRVASAKVGDRTFVASAVALIGLTILYLGNPSDAHTSDAFYAGCFLGMSAPERLKGWFHAVVGTLVLTVVLVPVRAFLPGIGGSLGFAAFVTVALLAAWSRVAAWRSREMLTPAKRVRA
jgi:hypothetical protein